MHTKESCHACEWVCDIEKKTYINRKPCWWLLRIELLRVYVQCRYLYVECCQFLGGMTSISMCNVYMGRRKCLCGTSMWNVYVECHIFVYTCDMTHSCHTCGTPPHVVLYLLHYTELQIYSTTRVTWLICGTLSTRVTWLIRGTLSPPFGEKLQIYLTTRVTWLIRGALSTQPLTDSESCHMYERVVSHV